MREQPDGTPLPLSLREPADAEPGVGYVDIPLPIFVGLKRDDLPQTPTERERNSTFQVTRRPPLDLDFTFPKDS